MGGRICTIVSTAEVVEVDRMRGLEVADDVDGEA